MNPELKVSMVGLLLTACAVVSSLTLLWLDPHNPAMYTAPLFLSFALFMPAEISGGRTMIKSREVARVFGENVRRIRRSKGLTQRELAALLGFGQSSVSHTEVGAHGPTLTTAVRYAQILDVPLSELVKGIDG